MKIGGAGDGGTYIHSKLPIEARQASKEGAARRLGLTMVVVSAGNSRELN